MQNKSLKMDVPKIRRKVLGLSIVLTAVWCAPCLGAAAKDQKDGSLPRGALPPENYDLKNLGAKKPGKPSASVPTVTPQPSPSSTIIPSVFPTDHRYCNRYFTNPPAPRAMVDGKKSIFYLARGATSATEVGGQKYILFKITISRDRQNKIITQDAAKKILSVVGQRRSAFLLHESPAVGMTLLGFPDDSSTMCWHGSSSGHTMALFGSNLDRPKPARTIVPGRYSLVESDWGRMFYDLDRGMVKTIDPRSMQQRVVYQVDKSEQPIYWNSADKQMYVWGLSPDPTLTRRGSVKTVKQAELKLRRGEKLAFHNGKFAVSRTNSTGNSVSLAFLQEWSGVSQNELFTMTLPIDIPADEAFMQVNFTSRTILLSQEPKPSRKSWGKAFVYKLNRGIVTTIDWTKEQSLDVLMYGPEDDTIVAILEDRTTEQPVWIVKIFDLLNNEWQTFKMN